MKTNRGLTLVEVLIAMTLLIIVWVATSQVLFASAALNQTNHNRVIAQNHLNSVAEFFLGFSSKSVLLEPENFPPSDEEGAGNPLPVDQPVPSIWLSNAHGHISGESISYRYPNYDPDNTIVDDGIESDVPQTLQIILTVIWEEKGRAMNQSLLTTFSQD